MIRLLRTHGDMLIGAVALAAGVFMACVLGPTLDHHDEIANDSRGGKTAYAAKD
ncbi:hypothetical protein [Bordetella bronchiseptica]|uniref:hypothetical protein n=1 Tax=Bordetella bronchiseptica TaxID=518 RepID=UPI001910F130|nr:hypothetical protein [Bordetella bronchiseptica]